MMTHFITVVKFSNYPSGSQKHHANDYTKKVTGMCDTGVHVSSVLRICWGHWRSVNTYDCKKFARKALKFVQNMICVCVLNG